MSEEDVAEQAIRTLDEAISAFTKLIFEHEDVICTAWVLSIAGMHPETGECFTSRRMPGQSFVATRGLTAYAEDQWR